MNGVDRVWIEMPSNDIWVAAVSAWALSPSPFYSLTACFDFRSTPVHRVSLGRVKEIGSLEPHNRATY
jgi:hypothetical protein